MKRALLIVMALATAAHADDKEAAERYFRAGSKAYSAQNFAAAAADFDEAYKAMPLPEIAFSAAQAYRRLYRLDPKPEYVRRAVELYRVYLEQVKTGGRVGDAADNLGEMERELDRLGIKLTASAPAAPAVEHTRLGVSVTIAGQASDTSLREVGDATGEVAKGLHATLDGKPIEPFALVDVDAREHVIAVTADGYFPAEKHVVAIAGQAQLIELELRREARDGHGQHRGRARRSRSTAAPRRASRSRSRAASTCSSSRTAAASRSARSSCSARGEALAVAAPLRETSRRRAVPWVFGGAGVLAAGAITTGIVALVRDGHASDLRDQLAMGNQPASTADDYDRTVNSRDHFVTATWILGGAAVAAGATGAAAVSVRSAERRVGATRIRDRDAASDRAHRPRPPC